MGIALGFVAYGLWGLFPLYFHLLQGISPVEVVANRVVWSLVFLVILTLVTRSWAKTLAAARSVRTVGMLAVAAAFLALNWGVYVWAVVTDQVVEASLGYFINPLVSVGLGVLVLRERLRPGQWAAVGIAIAAVAVLAVSYGRLPWISLILAFSFGIYGLLKKQVGEGAVESLTIETATLAPIALVVMAVFAANGTSAMTAGDPQWVLLLVLLGPVTAIPLLAFGGRRDAHPAVDPRPDAVLHARLPVPAGRLLLRRGHVDDPLDRVLPGLDVARGHVRRRTAERAQPRRRPRGHRAGLTQELPVTEPD